MKSDNRRLKIVERNSGFEIRAINERSGRWKITKLQKPEQIGDCEADGSTESNVRKSKLVAYSAEMLAAAIAPKVASLNTSPTASETRSFLLDYVFPGQTLTDAMIHRIRTISIKENQGEDTSTVRLIPDYVRKLQSYDHKAKASYIGKTELLAILERDENFDADRLPPIPDEDRFVECLYFAPASTNVEHLCPVFAADAAHIKEGKPGTMYSLWGFSANKEAVMVAISFMLENESLTAWNNFFAFVKEAHPSFDNPSRTVIMDGHKGGRRSFNSSFCETGFFACSQHLGKNVGKNLGAKRKNLWRAVGEATTELQLETKYNDLLEGMNQKQVDYINEYAKSEQFIYSASVRGGRSVDMLDRSSSQVVESMNHALMESRRCNFYMGMSKAVLREEKAYLQHQEAVKKELATPHVTTPAGRELLNKTLLNQVRQTCEVEGGLRNGHYTVSCSGRRYSFEWRTKKCSCGIPSTKGFPCVHAMTVAHKLGIPIWKFFPHSYYTIDRWSRQFPADYVFKVPTTLELLDEYNPERRLSDDDSATAENLRLPPAVPRKAGRPKAGARFKDPIELSAKRVYKCSNCKKTGHQATSCKEELVDISTAPRSTLTTATCNPTKSASIARSRSTISKPPSQKPTKRKHESRVQESKASEDCRVDKRGTKKTSGATTMAKKGHVPKMQKSTSISTTAPCNPTKSASIASSRNTISKAPSEKPRNKKHESRVQESKASEDCRIDKRVTKKTNGATTMAKKRQAPKMQRSTPTSTNKKTRAATTTAKKQVPVTQRLNSASAKKKSPATDIQYDVEEFLAKSDEKILVGWKHHSDVTWEPIETLKKDLGSNFVMLCKRMEDRAKFDDGESITSSEDDDTPLSSLIGSSVPGRE